MCEEMINFRNQLDQKGIKWIDKSDENEHFVMHRTHFDYDGKLISVINGYGSYGGFSFFSEKNLGLLEVMVGENEPVGWLTCEEAIDYIFNGKSDYEAEE